MEVESEKRNKRVKRKKGEEENGGGEEGGQRRGKGEGIGGGKNTRSECQQCCQVYGYIRILRIFKAFLDYGGISPCAAVSTDFSSHARAWFF